MRRKTSADTDFDLKVTTHNQDQPNLANRRSAAPGGGATGVQQQAEYEYDQTEAGIAVSDCVQICLLVYYLICCYSTNPCESSVIILFCR